MNALFDRWKLAPRGDVTRKTATERHIAVLALGIARSLREGQMSLAEAEDELFNPDIYVQLKRRRLDFRLVELLVWGMELENVCKLGRPAIVESLDTIERLASGVLIGHQKHASKALRRTVRGEKHADFNVTLTTASRRRSTR